MSETRLEAVSAEIYVDIQRFLYREAAMLDHRQYEDWLSLLADDVHYRVTAAVARDAGAVAVDYSIIDEGRVELKSRVDQISNPRLTRAENPPSMMRRAVTNIEAWHSGHAGEFIVASYLLAHRLRPHAPEGHFYTAVRRDTLRGHGGQWRLARRSVQLDQITLFDGALSSLL